MVYSLFSNPQIEEKARKEVNKYISSEKDWTWENLKMMNYLDSIQKEAVRMYGPSNWLFPREATKDVFLNQIPISKGTQLSLNFFSNHFNPKYFSDPHTFRPERWQE